MDKSLSPGAAINITPGEKNEALKTRLENLVYVYQRHVLPGGMDAVFARTKTGINFFGFRSAKFGRDQQYFYPGYESAAHSFFGQPGQQPGECRTKHPAPAILYYQQ
jgi:hypothetical protein